MEETIAAVATAYGEGGIGIIRISGEKSLDILKGIFEFSEISARGIDGKIQSRKMYYGKVVDTKKNEIIDEALAVYMKGPKTYTAEDVVEINCHGSIVSLKKTLALVLNRGARLAEKGEFTKRAFLNGRIDLSQAEAVIDLIKAKTDKNFDVAISQLEGNLSKKIVEVRKIVLDILVELTVNIDYPDEDIEKLTYQNLLKNISQINDMIDELLKTSNTGRMIREGLNVAIVGKPNVGKSSLMNAMLKEDRAIVTEIPGTTRDTIEEWISIKDIPIKLTDTAGIRGTSDQIEKIGIEKSKDTFNKADLIIFVLDSSEKLSKEDEEIIELLGNRTSLILLNKSDLKGKITGKDIKILASKQDINLDKAEFIETSMQGNIGIDKIEDMIESFVYDGEIKQNESMIVSNVRHINLLQSARKSLDDAKMMAEKNEALDFIEVDVKTAYEYLGEIIGETVSDDILDEVFGRFCLGK